MHAECNDADSEYTNAADKPTRRWMGRSEEAVDGDGKTKVGLPRVGWKHTPWGNAPLTGLPGVREYLRGERERGHEHEMRLNMLAEFGPQSISDAWMYFKHWVKGRPLSDAVMLPGLDDRTVEPVQRSDFGNQMPQSMYAYEPEAVDGQPHVYSNDRNAEDASKARDVPLSESEKEGLRQARVLSEAMRAADDDGDGERRAEWAKARDAAALVGEAVDDAKSERMQQERRRAQTDLKY